MAHPTYIQTKVELQRAEEKHYPPIDRHRVSVKTEFIHGGVKVRLTPLFDGEPGKTAAVTVGYN